MAPANNQAPRSPPNVWFILPQKTLMEKNIRTNCQVCLGYLLLILKSGFGYVGS